MRDVEELQLPASRGHDVRSRAARSWYVNWFGRLLARSGPVRKLRVMVAAWRRDMSNLLRFGPGGPRFGELIWVDTSEIRSAVRAPEGVPVHLASALVVDTAELEKTPLFGSRQFDSCVERWCLDVPWEQTLDYQTVRESVLRGERWSGCENFADVALKYKLLDRLFAQASEEERLRTRKELDRHAYREYGGIQVCIGKEGRLYLLENGGFHRLAVAWLLGFPRIPAQLGLVDREALQFLDLYRQNVPLATGVHLPLLEGPAPLAGTGATPEEGVEASLEGEKTRQS